ncbi:hypothetical protein EDB89DRAFT_2069824 [Lactarius sanguifluus]|nr:hypothetical protein EDB89DRAFT_2069824 [Lactarius sanguifluus]
MTTYGDDGTMLKNWVYCSVCSSSQVIAFVLPSKSSNSLAMWRCKVAVPNSVRLSHLREIELANATLRKDYPILVDEIRPLPDWPTSLPSESVPSLATAKKTTIVSKSTTMADDNNCDSKAATTTTFYALSFLIAVPLTNFATPLVPWDDIFRNCQRDRSWEEFCHWKGNTFQGPARRIPVCSSVKDTKKYKEGTTLNITTHADNVVPATVIPTTAIPAVIPATVPAAAIVFTTSPSQSSLVTAIPAVVVVTIAIFVARFVIVLVVSQLAHLNPTPNMSRD